MGVGGHWCAAEVARVWVGAGRDVLLWWRKRALIGAWGGRAWAGVRSGEELGMVGAGASMH